MLELAIRCRVCKSEAEYIWHAEVFAQSIKYYECKNCGYVQTEDPYWLEEAYKNPINLSDTGLVARNIRNSKIIAVLLVYLNKINGKVLDYAGGYGVLVRMLRDIGVDCNWSDSYCKNLFAQGFEKNEKTYDLVTAFEVFEHFVEPNKEINNLMGLSKNILFSTTLMPKITPRIDEWWYYGARHGQHIGFYREKTIKFLAHKKNKHYVSDGKEYHLISDIKINRITWRLIIIFSKLCGPLLMLIYKSKTIQDSKLI